MVEGCDTVGNRLYSDRMEDLSRDRSVPVHSKRMDSSKGKKTRRNKRTGQRLARVAFSLIAVALMLLVPLSCIGSEDPDASQMATMQTAWSDYGYVITTGTETIGGQTGQAIVKVEGGGTDRQLHTIYDDVNMSNLLYQTVGGKITENTTSSNPNYNDYFRFDEKTGLGPFNAIYVAINIGNTSGNHDLHKSSSTSGSIAYILNPYNLNEAIYSTDAGIYTGKTENVDYYSGWTAKDYNIMLIIPTVYWYADETHLWMSNNPSYFSNVDSRLMRAYAHTIDGTVRSYLALGVYEASEQDGKLVSQSGKTPLTDKSVGEFREMADELNDITETGEYVVWNYYQWTLYKMMSYTVAGTKNIQLAIGKGVCTTTSSATTGLGDEQGPYWGGVTFNGTSYTGSYTTGKNSAKLFLENSWGSLHEQLDDTWVFNGQLHAGQNSIDVIQANVNPNASYKDGDQMVTGSDEGLNENQPLIGSANLNLTEGNLKHILTSYTSPSYWDYPSSYSTQAYEANGGGVQYLSGNQTLSVGGHYDGKDFDGVNRINVRNSFGIGKYDVGTRLAYLPYSGTLEFSSGNYEVSTDFGQIWSGAPVQKGTTVTVTATGSEPVQAIYVNGVLQSGTSFVMPGNNVRLDVIVGNTIPMPVIQSYTYDGKPHNAVYNLQCYTISGTYSATDAGDYSFTLTPTGAFEWPDGSTSPKVFNWSIQKQILLVEGSSSAEVIKAYDGTKQLGAGEIGAVTRDDLFIHGLAHGELPNIQLTAEYNNANAGINKVVTVTSLSFQNSITFNLDNYIYEYKQFIITGTRVAIAPASLDEGDLVIADIPACTYTGEEITPEPTVRYNGKVLTKNSQFTYSYTDNVNAGTATITITGVGNYQSSASTTFTIEKQMVEWPEVVETPYDATLQSAGLQDTDAYSVVSDASGTAIGYYNATLSLKDSNNYEWAVYSSDTVTDIALIITDATYTISYDLDGGTWKDYSLVPTTYDSSVGATLPANNVSHSSTETHHVVFVGWFVTGDANEVLVSEIPAGSAGNKSFTAKYEETELTCKVSFEMMGHGDPIDDATVEDGDLLEKPEDPTDEEYNFIGWYKESTLVNPWDFSVDTVTEDINLFAKWEIKTFTVIWKNYNDDVLQTDTDVAYGTTSTYTGDVPLREADAQYSYTFDVWECNKTGVTTTTPVTQDLVFTATFSSTLNDYTVTFQDNPEVTLTKVGGGSMTVPYGTEFVFDMVLTSPYSKSQSTATVNKTCSGVTTAVSAVNEENTRFSFIVTDDAFVTVTHIQLNKYEIKWVFTDAQGEEDSITEYYNHGQTPVPPTINNTYKQDAQYTRSFSGWSPSITVALADATYIAQYEDYTVNTYAVSVPADCPQFSILLYQGEDKITDKSFEAEYGTTFEVKIVMSEMYDQSNPTLLKNGVPMEPDSDGFCTFTVVGPTSIGIMGPITINLYTITWKDDNGENLVVQNGLPYGTTPTYPLQTPTKSSTAQYSYTFDEWTNDDGISVDAPLTDDIVYKASYTQSVRQYEVTLQNSGVYTLTGSGTGKMDYGTEYTVTLDIIEGYKQSYTRTTSDVMKVYKNIDGIDTELTAVDSGRTTYIFTLENDTRVWAYNIVPDTYDLTWQYKDSNGEDASETLQVRYGVTPSLPNVNQSYSTAEFEYHLIGWETADGDPVGPITSDVVYIAQYSVSERVYYLHLPESSTTSPFVLTVKRYIGDSVTDFSGMNNVISPYGSVFRVTITMKAAYDQSNPLLIGKDIDDTAIGEAANPYEFTLTGDTTIELVGMIKLNGYDVTWKDDSGNTIKSQKVPHYTIPETIMPDAPAKEMTASQTFEFAGWSRSDEGTINDPIVEETVFTATYTAHDRTYTVSLPSGNGYTIAPKAGSSVNTVYNQPFTFVFSSASDIANFEFYVNGTQVTPVKNGSVYEYTIGHVTSDVIVNVLDHSSANCTVTWKNYNNTVLYIQMVSYNSLPSYPGTTEPTKPSTTSEAFKFSGWDGDVSEINEPITSNVTFTATFTSSVRTYHVTYPSSPAYTSSSTSGSEIAYNGLCVFDLTLDSRYSGSLESVHVTPIVNGISGTPIQGTIVGENTKRFSTNIIGDTSFSVGSLILNEYTITWVYEDTYGHTTSKTSTARYGSTPTPPMIPDYLGNEQYTKYLSVTSPWTPAITPVTENVTYTANYTEPVPVKYRLIVPNDTAQFTVTLLKKVGSETTEITKAERANYNTEYGSVFIFTVTMNEEYTQSSPFILKNGVRINNDNSLTVEFTVDGDTTIGLAGPIIRNVYTVKWFNEGSTTPLYTQSVAHGAMPAYPGTALPTKEGNAECSYAFDSWISNVEGVTTSTPIKCDVDFTASYTTVKNKYTVNFQSSEDVSITKVGDSEMTVDYGTEFRFRVDLADAFTKCIDNVKAYVTTGGVTTEIANGTVIDYTEGVKEFSFNVTGNSSVSLGGLTINTYTITWQYTDTDMTTKTKVNKGVIHGTMPSPGAFNTSYQDGQYTYEFSGWSPSVTYAVEDAIYVAQYDNQELNKCRFTAPSDTAQFSLIIQQIVGDQKVTITERDLMVDYGTRFLVTLVMKPAFDQSHPVVTVNDIPQTPLEEDGDTYEIEVQGRTNIGLAGKIIRNMYTVNWFDDDGTTLLGSRVVVYGNAAMYPNQTPVKPSTDSTSYVFDSWVTDSIPYGDPITCDVNYTASYTDSTRQYNITWMDYDGRVLNVSKVKYGDTPAYPLPDPQRESDANYSYSFKGWTPEIVPVSSDATYNAVYETVSLNYTVKWVNYNGAVLEVDKVAPGAVPSYDGAVPTKPSDTQWAYVHSGWDSGIEGIYYDTPACMDVTYTATFTSAPRAYTVQWSDYDGKVLYKESVNYGETPTYRGTTPTREADQQYKYTFSGWDPEVSPVTGDITYFPEFSTELQEYTVRWTNYDGTLLKSETVKYGDVPDYTGLTPVKKEPEGYKYTWIGWETEIVPVTGDVTYVAAFEAGLFSVHITVKSSEDPDLGRGTVENAGTVIADSNAKVHIGDHTLWIDGVDVVFTAVGDTSENELNLLIGWYIGYDNVTDGFEIDGRDLTIEAKFMVVPSNFSVLVSTNFGSEGMGKFTLNDGEVTTLVSINDLPLSTRVTIDGNSVNIGGQVVKALNWSDESSTMTFVKWVYILTGEDVHTDDMVGNYISIGAVYEKVTTTYNITWIDEDGKVLKEDTVLKGETPSYGSLPLKPASGDELYMFSGWYPSVVPAVADALYMATFELLKDSYVITVDLDGGESDIVNTDNGWLYDPNSYSYYKKFESGQMLYLGTATKHYDAHGVYSFSGWVDEYGDYVVPGVVEDCAYYRATFTSETKDCTVHFQNTPGVTMTKVGGGSMTVPYGSEFVFDVVLSAPYSKSQSTMTVNKTCNGVTTTISAVNNENTRFSFIVTDDTYISVTNIELNEYEIIWVFTDAQGNKDSITEYYEHGQTPVPPAINTSYKQDAKYTCSFSGWSPSVTPAVADTTYTALYDLLTVNSYPVSVPAECEQFRIILYQGKELKTETNYEAEYGTTFRIKIVMSEMYDQSNPKLLKNGIPMKPGSEGFCTFTVTGPTTIDVMGHIDINTYTISWVYEDTYDHSTTVTTTADHGSTPTPPIVPDYLSNDQYTKYLSSWTPTIAPATEDATYTAIYTDPTPVRYRLSIPNDTDQFYFIVEQVVGNELVTVTERELMVEYSTRYLVTLVMAPAFDQSHPIVTVNDIPQSPLEDGSDTYAIEVQSDTIINLTGDISRNTYIVNWYDEDYTTLLYDQIVEYGNVAKYPYPNPVKPSSESTNYVFDCWLTDSIPYGDPITCDVNYTASYTETEKLYTITWKNWNGTILGKETVRYGDSPTDPPEATRASTAAASYTFVGWSKNGEIVDLSEEYIYEDTTYVAVFEPKYKSFALTFDANGGSTPTPKSKLITYNSPYGHLATTHRDGYSFIGWYTAGGVEITSDTIVTTVGNQKLYAHWSENETVVVVEHEVLDDGTVIDRVTETTVLNQKAVRIVISETVTYINGTRTITVTETVEYTDGGSITVVRNGEGDDAEISDEIDIVVGSTNRVTAEQEKIALETAAAIGARGHHVHYVIFAGAPAEVPTSIIESTIATNGFISYEQSGNELVLGADTLEAIGLPESYERFGISATETPDEYASLLGDSPVYDIGIALDGVEYHDTFETPVQASVTYTLEEGQDASELSVYYLGENGLVKMEFEYVDGRVEFEMPHMSLYTIVYGDLPEPGPGPGPEPPEPEFPIFDPSTPEPLIFVLIEFVLYVLSLL